MQIEDVAGDRASHLTLHWILEECHVDVAGGNPDRTPVGIGILLGDIGVIINLVQLRKRNVIGRSDGRSSRKQPMRLSLV